MNFCLPDAYFCLDQFSHREIWDNNDPVWGPIGKIEAYLRSLKLGVIEIKVGKDVRLEKPELISIGKRTIIEPGVLIQGPCFIGENCIIRHGAYLRGNMIVGNRAAIGHSAELKNSILLNACAVTHFVYCGDSIIGSFVNLGAGVKCANLRIDRKEVRVAVGNEKIRTGLKKFGAIIGDRTQIGCNCVLNPGTLIGKECVIYPLLNVGGNVPSKNLVKKKIELEIEPVHETLLEQMGKF